MVRIVEALNDDDKIVIFKQNGRYKATKKSNYVRRMMDVNLVQDLKGFKSAEQIIDYYIKWYKGKLDEDDFIVVDSAKFESKENKPEYSSEYAVEVYDNNGKFVEQLDVFQTLDEAKELVKSLLKEDPQYIPDNYHYVISEVLYDENGEEIGIEDRYVW